MKLLNVLLLLLQVKSGIFVASRVDGQAGLRH